MIVTIFRSRLRPEAQDEYYQWAKRMSALAQTMPGYVSHKAYVAEDGERLTLIEFESAADVQTWAAHPDHVQAKKLGRQQFFINYRVQVCELLRDSATRSQAQS